MNGGRQSAPVQFSRGLSIASLVFGVLFYVVAVAGLLWPATQPSDVGLVSTTAVFVLFGAFGLLLRPTSA